VASRHQDTRSHIIWGSGVESGCAHGDCKLQVLRATAFARTLAQAGPCSVTLVADGPIRKFTEDHLESSHHKQHPEYQRARARAYEALQPLQVLQYMPPAQAAVQAVVTASPHLPQSEVAATTESDDVQQGVQSRVQGHDKAGTLCEDSNTGGGTPRSTAEAYRPGVQYIRGRLALQDSADELVPAHTLATLLRSASHAGCRWVVVGTGYWCWSAPCKTRWHTCLPGMFHPLHACSLQAPGHPVRLCTWPACMAGRCAAACIGGCVAVQADMKAHAHICKQPGQLLCMARLFGGYVLLLKARDEP
jgi:hypothetical protein